MSENIFKTILNSKRVNNYTKILILLNTYDYFKDYYIPNQKIIKALNISKVFIIKCLHQLEEDEIIKVYYRKNKRFFRFIKKENIERNKPDIFTYNWLEED